MSTQRRAYILIFVLGVTTVVTALGLSYISSNGTVMQQATNRYASVRAQYVAESGAALASHFVHYPPTTVAYSGVYGGTTGVAIDGSYDTVDITVTPTSPADHYTIQATSTVRNALGTESLGKQSIQCDAIVPPEPKWKLSRAVLFRNSATISAGVTVTGNIHSNGNVTSSGSCTGAVSASGLALWLGGGPPTSVQSTRPVVTLPPLSTALYTTYKVNNTACTAYTGYSRGDMGSGDAAGLSSAVNSSGNNPGRIVYLPSGDFKIKEALSFTGTLVVRGDLRLDANNINLQSVANYPALIVTGSVVLERDDIAISVIGPIICGNNISDGGSKNTTLNIAGVTVVSGSLSRTGSGSKINITWNAANSTFWNFTETANPEPTTMLEWKEN